MLLKDLCQAETSEAASVLGYQSHSCVKFRSVGLYFILSPNGGQRKKKNNEAEVSSENVFCLCKSSECLSSETVHERMKRRPKTRNSEKQMQTRQQHTGQCGKSDLMIHTNTVEPRYGEVSKISDVLCCIYIWGLAFEDVPKTAGFWFNNDV